MNCQELAQLLDEQDLHRLPAGDRAAAQAHLAGCGECARDHDMHLRLAALPVPPLAAERLAQWRGLAFADVAARLSRRRRLVLVGALTALAAAAAMLALQYPDTREEGADVAVKAALPLPDTQAEAVVSEESVPKPAQEEASSSAPVVAQRTPPAPPAYTLLAMPLDYSTDDVLVQAAVREFYAAVLDALRQIPGLQVTGPVASIDPAAKPTDFTLWAEALPAGTNEPGSRWEVRLRLRNGLRQMVQPFRIAGSLPGECGLGETQAACGPAEMATAMLGPLVRMIPVDHALESHLQARFLDITQTSAARLGALTELRALDAAQRGAGFGPDLVRPLVDVAYKDASDDLRLEAVSVLATTFPRNDAALAALAYIARDDAHPLVRKVAERAVNVGGSWRAFAVATARDATLGSAQRIAPLHWMAKNGATEDMAAVLGELLASDGAAPLAQLLSGSATDTSHGTRTVLDALARQRHPGAADFWLARFDIVPDFTSIAGLHAYRDDVRVRAKLEEIASGNADADLATLAGSLMH